MKKVVLQGHILVPDSDLGVVKATLPGHIQLTQQEAGCLVFNVTQDHKNPNRFNVYEEFADRDAFEKHQQRVRESRWGRITTNVSRHYEISGLD